MDENETMGRVARRTVDALLLEKSLEADYLSPLSKRLEYPSRPYQQMKYGGCIALNTLKIDCLLWRGISGKSIR